LQAIHATGAELWAIANDDVDKLRAFRDQEGLDFPILLDPEATSIRAYGVFNDQDSRGRLIPHPTSIVLDRDGAVRFFFIETNYRIRPASADLVKELAKLGS